MAISFKDTQGTVGIDWDTLTEGSYQDLGDTDGTAGNGLVMALTTLTGARTLRLLYPPNAASQSSFGGTTVIVANTQSGNFNIAVETSDGGGVVNVARGATGIFFLNGASSTYTTMMNF